VPQVQGALTVLVSRLRTWYTVLVPLEVVVISAALTLVYCAGQVAPAVMLVAEHRSISRMLEALVPAAYVMMNLTSWPSLPLGQLYSKVPMVPRLEEQSAGFTAPACIVPGATTPWCSTASTTPELGCPQREAGAIIGHCIGNYCAACRAADQVDGGAAAGIPRQGVPLGYC